MVKTTKFHPEKTVDQYFELIRELRDGHKEAVDKLVDMWDEDGVFEFAGAPPVTGTFKGRNAIHALYSNRVKACGMPLKLEGIQPAASGVEIRKEAALGVVRTDVNRMRTMGGKTNEKPERVVVGWTTVIGTDDKRGFEVAGSHTFTLKENRITSLKVVVSPKPDEVEGMSLQGLSVDDIGRLSLAAWAVV